MIDFTVNAIGFDGCSYPLYFEARTIEQAENIIKQLGIVPDNAGLCMIDYECTLDEEDGGWYEEFEEPNNGGQDPDKGKH